MKKYKVISPFAERDEDGNHTGNRPTSGETVELPDNEAERLKAACCVVEIEQAVSRPAPENRKGGKNVKRNPRKR